MVIIVEKLSPVRFIARNAQLKPVINNNSPFLENLRVSAILSNQGFNDLDRLPHRSLSLMASAGLTGWNGFSQERLSGQWQWTGKEPQLVLVIHNDGNLAIIQNRPQAKREENVTRQRLVHHFFTQGKKTSIKD
ncbi:hypothetical protein CTI12_AA044590 [Artemisia annua]|uniref:Uncharacterized protein n=1 Tax=Artemisia annua TaxID=35608 RepID=A0A2U1QD39_ARTAN|nr:hypothetical protein CTI12_AA044590 [Artemisia annua]